MLFNPFYDVFYLIKKIWDTIFGGETTTVEGKTLGVLGMPGAGKTQFYKTLKGEKYSEHEATSTEDYPDFNFYINEKVINIISGRDIGGGELYIPEYYEGFIKQKDIIVFIFNIERYLDDFEYARDVRDRLMYIWRKLNEKIQQKIEESGPIEILLELKNLIKTKYIIWGSHFDQMSETKQKQAMSRLHKSVEGKAYAQMLHNNMYLVDLTIREFMLKLFDKTKIFG